MATTTTSLTAIKGEILRFLLHDDYGRGEAQCKLERAIQCSRLPDHEQGQAKQAIKDMKADPNVPLYSKGGGDRKVLQLNPAKLDDVKRLCNEWHPDREPGQSFDKTDLSSPDTPETVIISVPYDQQGAVWRILETQEVSFTHTDGATADHAPTHHIQFTITDTADDLTSVLDALRDATNGDLTVHENT